MSEAQSDTQESLMFNDRFRDDAGAYSRAAGRDALEEAQDADRLIRSTPGSNTRYRRWRTLAVVQALAAGIPIEEVADALRMAVSDLERLVADGALPADDGPIPAAVLRDPGIPAPADG